MDNNIYWQRSPKGGYEFSKEFYDLSLKKKYEMVQELGELDYFTNDRLVRAILQHSSPIMKRHAPVLGERRQSRTSRLADEAEATDGTV